MAYGAVLSTKQKIERLQQSSRPQIILPNTEMKSVYEDLCSLESILRDFAEMDGSNLRFGTLEKQVEDAVYQIEDLMESLSSSSDGFLSQSQTESPGDEILIFSQDLFKVQQEMTSLKEKLKMYKADYDITKEDHQRKTACFADLLRRIANFKSERERVLVGLDDEVKKMSEWLRTRESSIFEIMSVVGLGDEVQKLLKWVRRDSSILEVLALVGSVAAGLVRQVYEDPCVQCLFDYRLWVTIGPNGNIQQLTLVLGQEGFYIDKRSEDMGNVYLVDHLYEILCGKKYLIVLVDVWSPQVWDDFRSLLPNDGNRSQVIFTTGQPNVARDIGKKIANNCKGLPVAIPAVDDDLESESRLVGLDDEVLELKNWIFNGSNKLHVKCIVGMVGIGKTTLVRQVYDHPSIKDYFDCRFWVNIGPNYVWQEFIQVVLEHRCFHNDEKPKRLGNVVWKEHCFLCEKRFLIVLDDIWSILVWDKLKLFFPNRKKGCRVILITRLSSVACDVTYDFPLIPNVTHDIPDVTDDYPLQKSKKEAIVSIYGKRFLNNEESWNLLHWRVFTALGVHCSYELQKYGKKIAENCEGLPLAILAVGKHLCEAEKTVEYWKEVSEQENLYDIIKDDYRNISGTIFLSYKMLPRRLKECFLYIGIIPKYEILVSVLTKLWCAELFFGPQRNQSIEDTAEEYLHDLISQNVVLVHDERSQIGRIKRCGIHFVFRYLCVTEAKKEKFCLVVKKYVDTVPGGTNWQHRMSIQNNVLFGIKQALDNMESLSSLRSLLCLGPLHQHLPRVRFNFQLLKVLNAISIRFYEFPHKVLQLVRLKYLGITYDGEIPGSISELWNLEVLVVGRHNCIIPSNAPTRLPVEIWNLNWLRHLQCMGMDLPIPCAGADGIEHLITLSGVSARSCSPEVLTRVPNLKKLGIRIELAPNGQQSLSFFRDVAQQLHNLQTFKCVVLALKSQVIVSPDMGFPNSLMKLTLSGCRLPWDYMAMIGRLPLLEVLKLRSYAFCGPQWITGEGEFLRLEMLLLEDLDIEDWITDIICFIRLHRLMIRHCYKLHSIPLIHTLTRIELDDCNPGLVSLAKQIKEEKLDMGLIELQVCTNFSWDKAKKQLSVS